MITNSRKSGSTFRVVLDAAIAFTQSGEPLSKGESVQERPVTKRAK
ncbi:hypothetical protein LC605_17225 [Nostoc sp. CHAB 5836]|nr:hypothetical protein [Nostoc sp. CHAB 5836]